MGKVGQKQWTVMVYLAGDNNLDAAGITDVKEMKTVGSTRGVDLLAQVDRLGGGHATKRYHLKKGTSLAADAVQTLGETNMGDPAVLEDFLRWGMKGYPAKRFLVILWNHGSGWDDEDIYRTARRDMGLGIRRRGQVVAPPSNGGEKSISVRRVRNVGGNRFRRALFNTTIKTAVSPGARPRAIAFDDTSKDFLDNIETKRVLSKVTKELNRKIDILGMDACLMSMAEVAYQVRDSVRVTVGSEEVEPGDGWPYDTILKELAAKPEMTPEQLAVLIVDKYLASYAADANVTQSACDLGKCGDLAGVIDRLAKALNSGFSNPNTRAAILESRIQVQAYEVPEYVDLYNFCELLRAKVSQGTVATACQKVMDAVRKPGFVLSSGYKGTAMEHSNGLAIYFPNKKISPLYGTLDFTKETMWDQFLEKYLSETTQAPRSAGRRSVPGISRRPNARA